MADLGQFGETNARERAIFAAGQRAGKVQALDPTSRSMRPSWHRGEFWLIALYQVFVTWGGGYVLWRVAEATPDKLTPELLAAVALTVGAVPFLYLQQRVNERKALLEDTRTVREIETRSS